jgi:predicted cobalt transporter CbtA
MEQTKKYRAIWWLAFLASSAILGYMIYSHNEWLTLMLPFVTTSFVKAMDIM